MGADTAISWTDATFNPWWGCVKVSPACDNCYAEAWAKRTGHNVWGKTADRRFFGDKHWAQPLRWNAEAAASGETRRVFCASMADIFEANHAVVNARCRLWDLIDDTPALTWQLLTKRPENVKRFAPAHWWFDWPEHVWLGVTAEDQPRANLRIPRLLDIPAKTRFLSCEPLLGPLDLTPYLRTWREGTTDELVHGNDPMVGGTADRPLFAQARIEWVICGGESGPGHRPLNLDHARSLRDQCAAAGVPFFFKQVGGRTPTAGGDQLDGVTHKEFPHAA